LALGHVFLRVLWFFSFSVGPPMLHYFTHLPSTLHCYISTAVDSMDTNTLLSPSIGKHVASVVSTADGLWKLRKH
jgi:hypothetical protein